MKSLRDCQLYTFVDVANLREGDPEAVARALCEGGADVVQLRAKGWAKEEIRRAARTLLPITEKAGVWLVVNDFADIAREIGAPLVHLGQEDFFDAGYTKADEVAGDSTAAEVGRVAPRAPLVPAKDGARGAARPTSSFRLGLSSHSPEQAARAIAAGADYIAVGPVFATPTKPGRPGVGLEFVRWAAENVRIPWFAIGGISLENLDDVLGAGATRVCVVRAILDAPDIAEACRDFKKRLPSAP